MQKWKQYSLTVILTLSIVNNVAAQKVKLLKSTVLPSFPSASALELFQNRLFVIGDDAPQLLILNKRHRITDSVRLIPSLEKRIAKEEKPDFESAVILKKRDKNLLLIFSSFSAPNRNKIAVLNLKKSKKISPEFLTIETANATLFNSKEVNIEGAAIMNDVLVLSNRANNNTKINEFFISEKLTDGLFTTKGFKKVTLNLPPTKNIVGISGLTYCVKNDILLFTASTENTANAYDDGEIGESYIGYIKDFSTLQKKEQVKAEYLIPLSAVLKTAKPQKIESIAVQKAIINKYIIHLAADNDDGQSTIFKLKWRL